MAKTTLSLCTLALLLSLSACQPAAQKNGEEASDAQTGEAAPLNTLTDAEQADGWKLLFNGQNADGWHVYLRDTVDGWAIENGELVALGQAGLEGLGNDIVTDAEYENFELSIEWKVSEAGNSGIFFNVVESPDYKAVYETGPEYQLIDDEGFPMELETWQHTGANYAMHPPAKKAYKPVGEFNHTRIIVNKGHVEHWLNGEKVVEYEMWTPEWETLVKEGKWKDYPAYGRAHKGHIALQDHGNQAWFRNIKLKVL